jgi:hypothetical protein
MGNQAEPAVWPRQVPSHLTTRRADDALQINMQPFDQRDVGHAPSVAHDPPIPQRDERLVEANRASRPLPAVAVGWLPQDVGR